MEKGTPRSLKQHAIGMIILSVIQYILGMITSLYISFPEGKTREQLMIFAKQQVPLIVHIVVGLLLLFGTIALLVRSLIQKDRHWIAPAAIATTAILTATITGMIFIPTQQAGYSLIMSLSFLIALLSYFWGLYADK